MGESKSGAATRLPYPPDGFLPKELAGEHGPFCALRAVVSKI
jgi:hypothetical protein